MPKSKTKFKLVFKNKKQTQKHKDAQTSIWCISSKEVDKLIHKIHEHKINIPCYKENNMLILKRNLTKNEYKILFPVVKKNLL